MLPFFCPKAEARSTFTLCWHSNCITPLVAAFVRLHCSTVNLFLMSFPESITRTNVVAATNVFSFLSTETKQNKTTTKATELRQANFECTTGAKIHILFFPFKRLLRLHFAFFMLKLSTPYDFIVLLCICTFYLSSNTQIYLLRIDLVLFCRCRFQIGFYWTAITRSSRNRIIRCFGFACICRLSIWIG